MDNGKYTFTSEDNWEKFVDSGDNSFLNDVKPEESKIGDFFVVAWEGGSHLVKVI